MFSVDTKTRPVHDNSTSQTWAATLRSHGAPPKPQDTHFTGGVVLRQPWVGAVSKPEITPFKHTKRLSLTEFGGVNTPRSAMTGLDSPMSVKTYNSSRAVTEGELRPVEFADHFSWERSLRSSTQPKPVPRKTGKIEERPWRSQAPTTPQSTGTRTPTALRNASSMAHSREPSMGASPPAVAHSRRASSVAVHSRTASRVHSRQGSRVHSRQTSEVPLAAAGGHSRRGSTVHSRKPSMAHSRRSTRQSIQFDPKKIDFEEEIEKVDDKEVTEEKEEQPEEASVEEPKDLPEGSPVAQTEEVPEPEPATPAPPAPVEPEGPQAVKNTLAGSMLVEQAELIASMTVKQVIEQLQTGTTVYKAWVKSKKQRGSTRHVKARVANDLVLLQYPSGFSKRQVTVCVSSIYVTVEPTKTSLTLETDNGTLVLKPYTPEHSTLWAFGFNALLHLADKQGGMDENICISELPWHGIFQSTKPEPTPPKIAV